MGGTPIGRRVRVVGRCVVPDDSVVVPFHGLLSILLLLPLMLSYQRSRLVLPIPPISNGNRATRIALSIEVPSFQTTGAHNMSRGKVARVAMLVFTSRNNARGIGIGCSVLNDSLRALSNSSSAGCFSIPIVTNECGHVTLVTGTRARLTGVATNSACSTLGRIRIINEFKRRNANACVPVCNRRTPTKNFRLGTNISRAVTRRVPLVHVLTGISVVGPAASKTAATTKGICFIGSMNGKHI